MKKQLYIGIGISCLLLSSTSARIWTSSEGGKTFSGEFKGFDETSGSVSVKRGGKSLSFKLDMLSAADQEWVVAKSKELSEDESADEVKSLADQKIGSALTSSVLTRLKGKRFTRAEITKSPEYYILYFTASW